MPIQYFLIKTENNVALSAQLENAANSAGMAFTAVPEGFETSAESLQLRSLGIRAIPSLVAVQDDAILLDTDNPALVSTFVADAEALAA